MPEIFTEIYSLLLDGVLPNLKSMLISQTEQKIQSEQRTFNFEEFRAVMQVHMAEIRAEIALCRQQLEDILVIVRERSEEDADPSVKKQKRIVH